MTTKHTRIRCWPWQALALLVVALIARGACAGDMPAVADGEHLWIVLEDPAPTDKDKPALRVYHLPTDAERGQMVKLDALPGRLMTHGLAAGDSQLLMVMADRRLEVVRPVYSELMQRWVYDRQSLASLPRDCTLVALAVGSRGPWALVRVESAETLKELDKLEDRIDFGAIDRALWNQSLGLPEDFDLTPGFEPKEDPPGGDQPDDQTPRPEPDDADAPAPEPTPADDADPAAAEAQPDAAAASPFVPAYRLIHLRASRWHSSPLPVGFDAPKRVELVMNNDDARPTLLAQFEPDSRSPVGLVRYLPIQAESESPAAATDPHWQHSPIRPADPIELRPGTLRQWSALMAQRQVIVAIESARSNQSVAIKNFLIRGDEANLVGRLDLPADGSPQWAAIPWRSGVALAARPGPRLVDPDAITPIAGLVAQSLNGELQREGEDDNGIVVLYESKPGPFDGNIDLFIQIAAFASAMIIMMLFYKRAPRAEQLDLPDRVVLASFGRRLLAGVIDLLPGFWVAGMLYEHTTFEQIIQLWPGNGLPKTLPAMRPGLVVIAVTLLHTSIFEFITARSIGKMATGLYVADLSGKPAPPGPALLRAVSRVFDLFAPLILILAVVSPARQRLGDILARTLVVMRLPDEVEQRDPNDEDGY